MAVKKEKTFEDFLAAGGIIGWVIIGLGLLALLIALLRTVNLRKLGSGRATNDEALWAAIESGDYTKAGTLVSELSGAQRTGCSRKTSSCFKNKRPRSWTSLKSCTFLKKARSTAWVP